MPAINTAIPGVSNLARKRKKAKRLAQLAFVSLPNWLKSWDRAQAKAHIDTVDFSDPQEITDMFKNLVDPIYCFRDILEVLED